MAWTSLSASLGDKPLVLAGPLLRKVVPDSVTVWLALRRPASVTLRVVEATTQRMLGTRHTIAFGTGYAWKKVRLDAHLQVHIVATRRMSKTEFDGVGLYDPYTSLPDEDPDTNGTQSSSLEHPVDVEEHGARSRQFFRHDSVEDRARDPALDNDLPETRSLGCSFVVVQRVPVTADLGEQSDVVLTNGA